MERPYSGWSWKSHPGAWSRPNPQRHPSRRARAPRRALAFALAALAHCGPARAAAQSHEHHVEPWVEDVAIGMANAFTGGLTAAVSAWLRDEDLGPAFVGGMLGGGVVFAGKRLVVEDFDGARLLGRQVGALGSNMVANAGAGAPWLGEIWLPVGPLWVQAVGETPGPEGVRLDAWRAATLLWAATRSELRVDWGASTSSGAFVFDVPEHELRADGVRASGLTRGSVVLLGPALPPDREQTLGHELVHVVQLDFSHLVWGRPLESWGWRRLFDGEPPVDIGVTTGFLLHPFVHDLQEGEAETLEAR